MNVLIEYICNTNVKALVSSSKVTLPLVRALMDDLNLLAENTDDMNVLAGRAAQALSWARMEWRGKKSRYLVLIKGKVSSAEFTAISSSGSEPIPSIAEKPVRFLGKWIDASICDAGGSALFGEKLSSGLSILDKSLLLGRDKVWILQFLLLPQVRSIIMIYDIPLSTAEKLEQRVSRFIRKWLGFHPTISSLALYSKDSPCPLPFTSLSSLYKTSKASTYLQLRDSKDPIVSSSIPALATGRKWDVSDAVHDAESILYFQKIVGHTQTGKAGFGHTPIQRFPDKGSKEHRKAVSDTVSQVHEQSKLASQEGKLLQTNWLTWCNYIRNDLSWRCIWAYGPQLLRFLR